MSSISMFQCFDETIYSLIKPFQGNATHKLQKLGDKLKKLPFISAGILLGEKKYGKLILTTLGYGLLAAEVNFLKKQFPRVRPYHADKGKLSGDSFISRHAADAFFGAGINFQESKGLQGYVYLALATVVAASRVLSGRHWVTDTIRGAALGLFNATVVSLISSYLFPEKKEENK